MKTNTISSNTAPIIRLKDGDNIREILADAAERPDVARARAFVEPFINGVALGTHEDTLAHADAVVQILKELEASESLQTAAYLVYAVEHIQRPKEVIEKAFGASLANLVIDTHRLVQVQHSARQNKASGADAVAEQTERARKMLLAFSRDLRGVMLRLASRLQTMRYCAGSHIKLPKGMAEETLYIFAPLANRLGIWQIKWELEDLAFRYLQPETYRQIATQLDERRIDRENYVIDVKKRLIAGISKLGVQAKVSGRPKHIYSIWKKMSGKSLDFSQVYDIRAFRIIVPSVDDCYAVLAWINANFEQIPSEFDDYIAKPKVNGYQSLHTVVIDRTPGNNRKTLEIQIRTQEMHDRAENGVAAHWAYKEAGTKGYSGVVANSDYDTRIAMMRQLLAWEHDLSHQAVQEGAGLFDDRIYVLTPMATLMELPKDATPLDFAYAVHSDLGHRCRGAKVDGAMVPLNTPLQNGQTVEIISAKEGGPSRDWLNADEHYLVSQRAKAKVRAWFNAQITQQTIARGREQVEKLLQREGKTALKLEDLATRLGFKNADALFEVVGKDEYSLHNIEHLFDKKTPETNIEEPELRTPRKDHAGTSKAGVLVVGMDSLLTQLAKCCKPAPPDEIVGYVTRGKGVSIHRADCSNILELKHRQPERVIDVQWEAGDLAAKGHVYAVDVEVLAVDRQGLLRDISEVLAKERINVIGVNTQSFRHQSGDNACMVFTVEIANTTQLKQALRLVLLVSGVKSAKRR